MADVCVTCLYKDDSPVFMNQDQLILLTKLLEPCSMFENLKHLLKVNAKICLSCQKKLIDITNFRNMVIMSLDLLNNMQDVFKVDSNYENKQQFNMSTPQNEAPTYITLGSEYVAPSVNQQQQQQVVSKVPEASSQNEPHQNNPKILIELAPAYKCLTGTSDTTPVTANSTNAQDYAVQTDSEERSIIKQERAPKVPYVNVLPPPELVGSGHSGSANEHDYSNTTDAEYMNAQEQVTQPLENERQWFIKTLTSDQIIAKMEEKRLKPEFASAPYKCVMCVIVFRSEDQLEAHTQACHTKAAGRFSCFVCSRRFLTLSALNRHVSLHSSRVYVCARCDLDSFDCREIKTHICVRGKKKKKPSIDLKPQKKWKCSLCDSEFKSSEFLSLHIDRIHRKSKILCCPKCKKTFKFAGRLKNHMREKHGDQSAASACMNCQKSFDSEKALKIHIKACMISNK